MRLYKLLEILGERACGYDTDYVVYADDGSEACKEIDKLIGEALGCVQQELPKNTHMDLWLCNGPKDYGYLLSNGKEKGKCKGFKYNAMVEEYITNDSRQTLIRGECKHIKIKETRFVLDKMNKITVKEIEKKWDYDFNKRMVNVINKNHIDTLPYGF